MVKQNEKDTVKVLEAIAEKFNYDLKPKKKSNPLPRLPKGYEKYNDMDSKKLSMELKEIELDLKKLEAQNERLRNAVIKFMNEQQPNIYNRSVFAGNNFDHKRLSINDVELNTVANLKNYVEDLLKKAVEKEMSERFVAMNPEFKGVVEDMSVQQTAVGHSLMVTVGGKLPEKELENALRQQQQQNKNKGNGATAASQGVTTMGSVSDLI